MRQFIIGLLLIIAVASLEFACTQSAHAQTVTFSSIKFGTKQFGDAQWNATACLTTTTCSSSAQAVGTLRSGSLVFTPGSTQYLQFTYTNTDTTRPWTLKLYNSNGSVAATYGNFRIINAGQGYFMISDASSGAGHGTLFSTQLGMVSGSVTFTETLNPTQAQMDSLASAYYSPTPIYTAGQTYTPAPQYVSSITASQQSTYNANQTKVASTSGNSIYIDQVGNNNTVNITQVGTKNKVAGAGQQSAPIVGDGNNVTIRQGDPSSFTSKANVTEFGIYGSYNTVNLNQGTDSTGAHTGQDIGGHYIYNYINGSNNSVTASQQNTSTSTAGQFLTNTVNGNNNTQNFVQSGAGGHQIFSTVTGDSNTMSVAQSGNGGHYLSVTEYGNGNDAQVTQFGNSKNNATINLTNAGAPASVTLQQSGGAVYNIDRTCTSTCGRVTVSQ